MKYKHLSYSDRQEMEKLYLQGWHMNDIAAKLGVSLATVYHERARGDTGRWTRTDAAVTVQNWHKVKSTPGGRSCRSGIKGGSQKWKCGTLRSRPTGGANH